MMEWVLVGTGGVLGAVARFLVTRWITRKTDRLFPWATFIINMTGSLGLGFLFGLIGQDSGMYLLLGTGFLGSFTTYSTFSLEVVQVGRQSKGISVIYLLLSITLGVCMAALGYYSGRIFGSWGTGISY